MRIIFIFLLIFSVAFCEQNNTKPSLKRMIGQMIITGFDSTSTDTKEFKQLLKDLSYGQIGGVIFLEKNFQNRDQLLNLSNKIRLISTTLPPFLGMDEGIVYGLNDAYDSYDLLENMAINSKPVKSLYKDIAKDINAYTVNLILSPNVKKAKNVNLKDGEISAYANEFIDIFKAQHIISAMKYFPSQDSVLNFDYKDLKVYFDMISRGKIDIIMSSWAKFENLDATNQACFSKSILSTILRNELKFNGVIMSDDLLKYGNITQNAVKAIIAGNDMVFISSNLLGANSLPNEIINAVNKAVNDGKISLEQIEKSYLRIQNLKEKIK